MEQKVVKIEIGKVLAVIITVVVIALVAGVLLQNNYFQGNIGEMEDTVKEGDYFASVEMFKSDIEKGLDFGVALEGLKKNLDVLVSEKYIDSESAQKTIEVFASFEDSDYDALLKSIEVSVPAYQKEGDVKGFVSEFEKISGDIIKQDALISTVDKLSIIATEQEFAIATAELKDNLSEAGVAVDAYTLDPASLETVTYYKNSELDSALATFEKDVNSGIEYAVAYDKLESSIGDIKQEVAIEVTRGMPEVVASISKDVDIQLSDWVDAINSITKGGIKVDDGVLAKYIDSGKGFDELAKQFDAFMSEIEKGVDVDTALGTFVKGADTAMPGVFITQF